MSFKSFHLFPWYPGRPRLLFPLSHLHQHPFRHWLPLIPHSSFLSKHFCLPSPTTPCYPSSLPSPPFPNSGMCASYDPTSPPSLQYFSSLPIPLCPSLPSNFLLPRIPPFYPCLNPRHISSCCRPLLFSRFTFSSSSSNSSGRHISSCCPLPSLSPFSPSPSFSSSLLALQNRQHRCSVFISTSSSSSIPYLSHITLMFVLSYTCLLPCPLSTSICHTPLLPPVLSPRQDLCPLLAGRPLPLVPHGTPLLVLAAVRHPIRSGSHHGACPAAHCGARGREVLPCTRDGWRLAVVNG